MTQLNMRYTRNVRKFDSYKKTISNFRIFLKSKMFLFGFDAIKYVVFIKKINHTQKNLYPSSHHPCCVALYSPKP